jgi:hypothetical protein
MLKPKSNEEKAKYSPIQIDDVCKKLRNLTTEISPRLGYKIGSFAESLANRLDGKGIVYPQFFYGTALKLLDDIMNSQALIDEGDSSVSEYDCFANLDPIFYSILRSYIPTIAYAVCPQGFAEAVEEHHRIRNEMILVFGTDH